MTISLTTSNLHQNISNTTISTSNGSNPTGTTGSPSSSIFNRSRVIAIAVLAAIFASIVLVSGICWFIIARNRRRRRQFDANRQAEYDESHYSTIPTPGGRASFDRPRVYIHGESGSILLTTTKTGALRQVPANAVKSLSSHCSPSSEETSGGAIGGVARDHIPAG
ncbi:hypothetical protein FRB91_011644 [Serendipita sp. 411]|nr:hypothetical protein FRB91_011644 [Serendipita sp. 411]